MIEEKLSKRVTVVLPKSMNKRLDEVCRKTERPKSNLIRFIVQKWLDGFK
jgi:predicted DNA-binding protein